MEKKNDINNLINKFDKKASIPDAKFRYALKQQLINQYDKKGLIENFVDKLSNINLKTLSIATSMLFLTVIGFVSFNIYNGKNFIELSAPNTQASENQKIIRNILNSNPNSQINLETSLVGKGFQLNDISPSMELNVQNNTNAESYYYKLMKQEYKLGPQSTSCDAILDSSFPKTSYSNFALKLDNTKYLINNLSYNAQNLLVNNYYTDNVIQTLYFGGQYTAQFDINTQLAKNSLSNNNLDYTELKLVENDKQSYYQLIRNSDLSLCKGYVESNINLDDQLINVLDINIDNYKIRSSKYYLNSVNEDNLILTIESTYLEKYDIWDNLKDNFLKTQSPTNDLTDSKLTINLIKPEKSIESSNIITSATSNSIKLLSVLFDNDFYPVSKTNFNLMKKTITDYNLDYSVEFFTQYTSKNEVNSLTISAKPTLLNTNTIDKTDSHSNNLAIYINNTKAVSTFNLMEDSDDQFELKVIYDSTLYTINYSGDLAEVPRFTTFAYTIE